MDMVRETPCTIARCGLPVPGTHGKIALRNPDQIEGDMENARRFPRITDVPDVRARFGAAHDSPSGGRVLNLSEGGMLVADRSLDVGEKTGFELSGRDFHYAGVAEVVHLTSETTGLRFLSWHDHDNRPIRSLIEQRSDWHAPTGQDAKHERQVIRRVAVVTGRKRKSTPKTPPTPPGAGSTDNR